MNKEITIEGMTWDHPRAYTCLVAASEAYKRETGVQINWHKRSLQAFADQPLTELTEKYDLIIYDHPHVGQIAESGCLAELPTEKGLTDSSVGGSSESYIWQGKQWAYAVDAACQMAVTRSDIKTPFPQFWEDVTKDDAHKYGLLTPLKPVDALDMMLTLIASCGEENLPLSLNEFCSTKNGLHSLRILKSLFKLGPEQAVSWNPIDVLENLANEDDFSSSPCLFGYINYAREGFRPHQLEYVNLPTFKEHKKMRGILGGAGIGVSAQSSVLEQAKEFARWVSSADVQAGVYLENEGQPAHKHAWTSRKNDKRYTGFLTGSFETMNNAWTRPRDEWFLHFVDDACDIFPSFFLKDQTEEEFLKQINKLYRHHTKRDQT